MTAELLVEAIDTAVTLGWALAAWIAVLAALTTLVLFGALAVVAVSARALWRRTVRPSWACGRVRARILARRRLKRPQSRTADLDYEEAA